MTTPHGKIFILGLPRTATTSVCLAMLELGYKVAHTAYTNACFEQADVIADTPVFADYAELGRYYPGSRFILLERDLTSWIPSIRQLLERMYTNLQRQDGGFNPHLKRCYNQVFNPLTRENIASDDFLATCYERHHNTVIKHFKDTHECLLTLNVSKVGSMENLLSFLNCSPPEKIGFEKINKGGKVTAWNEVYHPNKVDSTRNGRIDKDLVYRMS